MGVYQYTMRKDSREVDGIKIGRFEFAYKLGRDWEPGGRTDMYKNGKFVKNRVVLSLEAKARSAREALADVRYVVVSNDFNDAAKYDLPVYEVGRVMYQFTEELDSKDLVGVLRKVGRVFKFIPAAEQQAA
jgi:hypothetical protein